MVEANGDWHTSDNKHASAGWKALHPPVFSGKVPSLPPPSARSPSRPLATTSNGKAKATDSEVFVLDSDDEDEGQVKRELSPSFASGSSVAGSSVPQTQSQVTRDDSIIDLTLESDEDEPPPPRQTGKRKAMESDTPSITTLPDQMWKKSRLDSGSFQTPVTNGDGRNTTPSLCATTSPLRYTSGYPPSPGYPYSAGASSSGNSRLPSFNTILPETNGRWS